MNLFPHWVRVREIRDKLDEGKVQIAILWLTTLEEDLRREEDARRAWESRRWWQRIFS